MYGGTKTEMERLLADAEKFSGVHYDISNLNDVYEAIHIIQGELGITGTTADEASSTITGSVASAKAAFQNFLAGTGGIEEVIETFITAGTNIANAITKMLPQIVDGIVGLLNGLIPLIPKLIQSLLPGLVDGAVSLLNGIVQALPELIKVLAPMLPEILTSLINGLVLIINTLAEMMPELLPVIIDAVLGLIPVLIDNMPLFIKAGYQLLIGIIQGLIKAIPILLSKTKDIAISMLNYWKQVPGMMFDIGKNVVKGLWNGIQGLKDWVINKVKALGKAILSGIKGILGIHSPSTEFALIGKYSVLGYTEALDKMDREVKDQLAETFALSPELSPTSSMHFSPNIVNNNYVDVKTDPLGQMVSSIKTFSGGAKNDYNYGAGV